MADESQLQRELLMKVLGQRNMASISGRRPSGFDRYLKEGKDYEFLVAHLTAFEKFVNGKPLAEEKNNTQLNCIRSVRKMIAVKFEKPVVPEIEKVKLRSKLEGLQPIVSKKWLFEN